jgi:beta-aspartyl-peptidase (threonine type)
MTKEAKIIIHGGAINPDSGDFLEGIKKAAIEAVNIMKKGGSALDAVTEAIYILENNPIFNAGKGAWPNLKGEVEMDAIIMDGRTLKAGAVAAVKNVKSPIKLARKIMEETDHILIVGSGAEELAKAFGLYEEHKIPEERLKQWEEIRKNLIEGKEVSLLSYWKKISKWIKIGETVGAVAIDREGSIAAGTSSGGFPMKLPGRVGDVPIIGCSTFADNSAGGVSITGHGEVVMTYTLAKKIVDLMREGVPARFATEWMISYMNEVTQGKALFAAIAIDKNGGYGSARNTDKTPHAYFDEKMDKPLFHFSKIIV